MLVKYGLGDTERMAALDGYAKMVQESPWGAVYYPHVTPHIPSGLVFFYV